MASIKKNLAYQSFYQLLTMLLPLVTSPYIARVLGAEGVGIQTYTYSIISYFVMVARLGLNNYGNRVIARVRADRNQLSQSFCDLYTLHAAVTLPVLAVYVAYVLFCGGEYRMILLLQGGYLIGQLLDINWFFFGIEEFRVTVTRNTVLKVLTVVMTFVLVRGEEDVWKYAALLAAGSVLSESAVWLFVRRHITFVKPNIATFRVHLTGMLVFFVPAVAVSLYKVMDKIMLGAMAGTEQVGLYENSEKIINICLGLVTALGTVMMPRMTHLAASGDDREGKRLLQRSAEFVYIGAYAMAFGIAGVAQVFPAVFWGEGFSACTPLMCGLAVSLVFTAAANVIRTQFLIPQGRDRIFVSSVCVGAVVNLALNYVCIPRMGAVGAVVGTVGGNGGVPHSGDCHS